MTASSPKKNRSTKNWYLVSHWIVHWARTRIAVEWLPSNLSIKRFDWFAAIAFFEHQKSQLSHWLQHQKCWTQQKCVHFSRFSIWPFRNHPIRNLWYAPSIWLNGIGCLSMRVTYFHNFRNVIHDFASSHLISLHWSVYDASVWVCVMVVCMSCENVDLLQ